MHVEVTHDGPNDFLNRTVAAWLRQQAEEELEGRPYTIVADSVQLNATSRTQANVESDGTVTGDPRQQLCRICGPSSRSILRCSARHGRYGSGNGTTSRRGWWHGYGRPRATGPRCWTSSTWGWTWWQHRTGRWPSRGPTGGGALAVSVGSVLQELPAAMRGHRIPLKSEPPKY